jgi:hypothetical protein
MFSPAVALLNAYAVSDLWQRLGNHSTTRSLLASGAVLLILSLSLLQGLMQIEALNLTADPYVRKLAENVAAHTTPDDKIVVINGGWGGDLLILSGRQGLSADTPDIINEQQQGHDLQSLGYTKLVIASESPLLHAAQVTNPGSGQRVRTSWQVFTTPDFGNWREIYRSEDIVIKELPVNTQKEAPNSSL